MKDLINKIKIRLFKPHYGQKVLLDLLLKYQYVVACCGRRFGKSETALNYVVKFGLENKNSKILIMSYRGDQRKTLLNDFVKLYTSAPFIQNINHTTGDVTFTNNTHIQFRLASYPSVDGIRGKKFDLMILDEFSLYRESVFNEILEPTLATSKNPKVLFISTPRGRGLFYKFFQNENSLPNWKSIRFPSTINPLVSQEFIENVKNRIPERVFRQEYLAEFIDDVGGLFTNIKACINNQPSKSDKYYAGVDIGFKTDFTVVTIINDKGQLMEYIRFNDDNVNYKQAAETIKKILEKYNWPQTYIEINAHDSVYTYLKDWNVKNIHPLRTTVKNKPEMIGLLERAFETETISLLNDDYLISEFFDFCYERKPSGYYEYSAPDGLHDDIVMSLGMAFLVKKDKKGLSYSIISR